MSQNNKEMDGAGMAIAFVAMAVCVFAIVIAIAASFLALVMTIIAAIAWANGGLQIGTEYCSRDEGRAFILRGFAGAFLVPVFWLLVCAFADLPNTLALKWLVLAGYVLGSVGIEYLIHEHNEREQTAAKAALLIRPSDLGPAQTVQPLQPIQRPSFEFATWDDEAKR